MLTLFQEFPIELAAACSLLATLVTAAAAHALYRHRLARLRRDLSHARGAAATARELYAQARRQSDYLHEQLRIHGGQPARSANASGWLDLPEVTPLDAGAEPPRRRA